ncbi:hypothetical protein LTR10_016751 [Elasticomyces elasticus]|uniref:Ketoreductase domain-containing protein n=1 Tax=Exophiala sideris TaxID=1016849 RepID=A0ABR0JMQ0_9EURO|nr:hypothetical protein LTR10_016751 [Elasticomyces elasticus]KAK5037755.1 hypothetical protein LTS07_001222 [Exophiala sideris]KAK5043737.1 hypothetical protein LTR13_000091 [Exophiala sideris]KAK5067236.1 hypothetical protein LTR69_001223 [Exophiala sideris]KAK5182569.1 hypothetical protein LTR44_004960 [Eurotiomycetes sp. CCFEE 6388]
MTADLRWDGQTVIVTGAGQGLGRAYALFFGSRGANVVVNDLGAALTGVGADGEVADGVVKEIKAGGGSAVASYDSVQNGEKIVQTAIDRFGRIDVVINNAGILRDKSFRNMKDEDWYAVLGVHLDGAYKVTRAAWPFFRKQRYGRLINTSSATGLFGNFGQVNYGAAKMALIGFTKALAKEGQKYDILCNVVAPMAASRMTATVMTQRSSDQFDPTAVVPLVAVLTHRSAPDTGGIFEAGAGHFAKLRWQRSRGVILRPDDSYTAGAVLAKWDAVGDFSQSDIPDGPASMMAALEQGLQHDRNPPGDNIGFQGRVVVVTGAGAGLGRAYAVYFAALGASVVVNDLRNADDVVNEIQSRGGKAVANKDSATNGASLIKTAIDSYGRIDILVNNAGILRDKSFHNMTDQQWQDVIDVHLHGTYQTIKAAFPIMVKQKYGRIINTTSVSGIYGTFGQVNYSAAKAGIIGLSRSLAIEGQKYNVLVNVVAPTAGTQMSATTMPPDIVERIKPDYLCPLIGLLASEKVPSTGLIFEAGCGWQAQLRWQRSGGVSSQGSMKLTPEALLKEFPKVLDFDDGRADFPTTQADARKHMAQTTAPRSNEWIMKIKKAMDATPEESPYSYDEEDSILYNLSVGSKRSQPRCVYERDPKFQVLPTFGVVPYFGAKRTFQVNEIVPNFKPMMLLHGEQYLEIRKYPIPVAAKTTSQKRLLEVVDKGNAALITTATITKDASTGEELFYNEETVFIRGSGGFGGPKARQDRGPATTTYKPPQRTPDATFEDKVSEEQAALYRLNGDRNPLHIDFEQSQKGGFPNPILHGLCTMGFSGRRIVEKYGLYKNIKVRFTGVVIPGQNLKIELWKEKNTVIFRTTVVETGKVCISGGAQLQNLSAKLA